MSPMVRAHSRVQTLRQRPRRRYHVLQRRAGHVRDGQPGRVVVRPGGDHRGRVHRVDRLRGGDLPPEPRGEGRVAGQVRVDHLHRHRPASRGEAQVHPAHPARAEPGLQPEVANYTRIIRLQRIQRHSP